MGRQKLDDADIAARATLLGRALRLCVRDDAKVVRELHETQSVDDVEVLDKVTFGDEFMQFLKQHGVWKLFEALDPGVRVNALIPWSAMVGVYLLRILLGVPSVPQTEGLILTDPTLMALFGLAAFVERGLTQRGVSRANTMPEVRGAFSGEAMGDALVKCSLWQLAKLFNQVIQTLAQAGFFPKNVYAVCDCTDYEATPKYRMVGGGPVASVTRKKRPDHRNNRHAPKVETTVWGWKVWLLFCPTSGIPIAMYVDRIHVDDRAWMLALVQQGKENLGDRLRSVSFDRGFWDGQTLYQVAKDVPFFIPGKADLLVTKEARKLAAEAYARWKKGLPTDDAIVAERQVPIVTGRGKNRREETQSLRVIGLGGLPCDTYAAEAPGAKLHSKSFVPGTLNAVVVIEDPSYPRSPDDADKYLVILTCAKTDTAAHALFAYDRFDDRGVIENSGNKEAKQAWNLEFPLEKSEPAVYLHSTFVFLLMALMAAFRAQKETDDRAEAMGKDSGMKRYRRELEKATRQKVVVRSGDFYAVMGSWELAILLGARLRWRPDETAVGILDRYTAAKNEPPTPKGGAP